MKELGEHKTTASKLIGGLIDSKANTSQEAKRLAVKWTNQITSCTVSIWSLVICPSRSSARHPRRSSHQQVSEKWPTQVGERFDEMCATQVVCRTDTGLAWCFHLLLCQTLLKWTANVLKLTTAKKLIPSRLHYDHFTFSRFHRTWEERG